MKALLVCDDGHPAEATALAARWGCGIEFQSFYDPGYYTNSPDAVERHRPYLTGVSPKALHGPFGDLCPGSFDPKVRELAHFRFDEAAAFAAKLDIEQLILHHGYYPNTSVREKWIQRSAEFWQAFLADIPSHRRVHLENVFETDISMLSELMVRIGDPRIDLCLDIGHAHAFSKVSVLSWIERLGPQIGYVHLHDNLGERDEHLALGEGTVPLQEILEALNERTPHAYWAIESQLSGMEKSHCWLCEHGFAEKPL